MTTKLDPEVGEHSQTRARMAALLAVCRTADIRIVKAIAEDVAKVEHDAIAATSRRRELTGHEILALDGHYSVPSKVNGRRDIFDKRGELLSTGVHACDVRPSTAEESKPKPDPRTFILTIEDATRPGRKWTEEVYAESAEKVKEIQNHVLRKMDEFDCTVTSCVPKAGV